MDFDTTPLPWSLDCDGDLMAADRTLVAIIPAAKDRPLLAAAPKMLAALKSALECIDGFAGEGPTYREVKAAIAAAESTGHL